MGGGGLGAIGGIAGAVAGTALGGPLGTVVGGTAGSALGNMLGGATQNKYNAQGVALQTPTTNDMSVDQYNNSQDALAKQRQFVDQVNASNGVGNLQNAYNSFQGVANGTGPNPALAQLNQSTGQNVANQAALMASARGAGANPALASRQAAMQGANIQQQAVGQGATMQAQQQLAAQQQMANIAAQQQAAQAAAIQGYGSQSQGLYGQVSNNIAGQNNSAVGQNNSINQINAGIAQGNQATTNNLIGNLTSAAGSAAMMGALGGSGGASAPAAGPAITTAGGAADAMPTGMFTAAEGGVVPSKAGPRSKIGQMFANGGKVEKKVPALVSPGEKYLPPSAVQDVKKGASPMAVGQTIPGTPKVGGAKNSYANDTVPASLDEGGIVLPRSVTQSKDPSTAAAKFVAAVLKKQNHKGKK